MRAGWIAAVLILGVVSHAAAQTDRRVALVVGNSAYMHVPKLKNPENDARLIARTLQGLGFELVGGAAQTDLDKSSLDLAVQRFGQLMRGANVGLFYYAGHGMQVRGSNYLAPISANPVREADIDFQMLDTNLVLRQMEGAGTRLNLMILDACRNNPFGGRGLRSTGSGLATMQAPEGTLISFATQPGNVALDGTESNSPYTNALAQAMLRPAIGLFDTFNEVGLAVKRETGGSQQPWLSSSPIGGTFFFNPSGSSPAPSTSPPVSAALPTPAPSSVTTPTPVIAKPGRIFRVHDDVSKGILNMRSGPGTAHSLVIAVPAGSSDLRVENCRAAEKGKGPPWCEAEWRGHSGWVSACCISEVKPTVRRSFRVLESVSRGILNVRKGPGTRHPLVASIPAGDTGLLVGRCRIPDDGGKIPWCEVEWRGRSGWTSSCCMVDVKTGAHGRLDD